MKAKEYVVKRLIEAENEINGHRELEAELKNEIHQLRQMIDSVARHDAQRSELLLELLKPMTESRYFSVNLDSLQEYEPEKYDKWVMILDEVGLQIKPREEKEF